MGRAIPGRGRVRSVGGARTPTAGALHAGPHRPLQPSPPAAGRRRLGGPVRRRDRARERRLRAPRPRRRRRRRDRVGPGRGPPGRPRPGRRVDRGAGRRHRPARPGGGGQPPGHGREAAGHPRGGRGRRPDHHAGAGAGRRRRAGRAGRGRARPRPRRGPLRPGRGGGRGRAAAAGRPPRPGRGRAAPGLGVRGPGRVRPGQGRAAVHAGGAGAAAGDLRRDRGRRPAGAGRAGRRGRDAARPAVGSARSPRCRSTRSTWSRCWVSAWPSTTPCCWCRGSGRSGPTRDLAGRGRGGERDRRPHGRLLRPHGGRLPGRPAGLRRPVPPLHGLRRRRRGPDRHAGRRHPPPRPPRPCGATASALPRPRPPPRGLFAVGVAGGAAAGPADRGRGAVPLVVAATPFLHARYQQPDAGFLPEGGRVPRAGRDPAGTVRARPVGRAAGGGGRRRGPTRPPSTPTSGRSPGWRVSGSSGSRGPWTAASRSWRCCPRAAGPTRPPRGWSGTSARWRRRSRSGDRDAAELADYQAAHPRPPAPGPRPGRAGDLRAAVPVHRLGGRPGQGHRHERPEPRGHLRRPGLGLPGRSPGRAAGRRGLRGPRPDGPGADLRHHLRAEHGLRGVPALADQGGLGPDRRQRPGGRPRAAALGPDRHLGGAAAGGGLRRVHGRRDADHQADRAGHGPGRAAGRHRGPDAAGPGRP